NLLPPVAILVEFGGVVALTEEAQQFIIHEIYIIEDFFFNLLRQTFQHLFKVSFGKKLVIRVWFGGPEVAELGKFLHPDRQSLAKIHTPLRGHRRWRIRLFIRRGGCWPGGWDRRWSRCA